MWWKKLEENKGKEEERGRTGERERDKEREWRCFSHCDGNFPSQESGTPPLATKNFCRERDEREIVGEREREREKEIEPLSFLFLYFFLFKLIFIIYIKKLFFNYYNF